MRETSDVLTKEEVHERLEAVRRRTEMMADRIAQAAGYEGVLRAGKIVRLKSGGPPMVIGFVE